MSNERPDMTQPNIPLLRKVLEWAEAEAAKPEIDRRWRQAAWWTSAVELSCDLASDVLYVGDVAPEMLEPHCGTAFCIAGYTGQLVDVRYATCEVVDDVHVADVAAQALGVDIHTAAQRGGLFWGGNTIADVRRIAEDIAQERL